MPDAPDRAPDLGPLEPDDTDRLLAPLQPFCSLAFGVSGGADSLALLHLFNDWRHRTGWQGTAAVVTVDHGLRTGSAHEAAHVAAVCADLKLPHHILHWNDEKPASNVQAAARAARYELISQFMGTNGSEALVLAHHLDDQTETFFDRLSRGSGVYGLGAMAPDERHGPCGIRILRPFLSVPKSRLVATLEARGANWCEDPSNADDRHKRVRLRRLADGLAHEGFDAARLLATTSRLGRAADALDSWVVRIWADHVSEHPSGPLKVPSDVLTALPDEVRLRLLGQLILRAAGRDIPVRLAKLENLDAALLAETTGKHTLAGAVILKHAGELFVWKELGRSPPPVHRFGSTAVAGAATFGPRKDGFIWDQRFRLSSSNGLDAALSSSLSIGPFSLAPRSDVDLDFPKDWPKEAFDCAAAVWSAKDLVLVPGLFRASALAAAMDLTLLPFTFLDR
ncbi:MAG: tRNA lysidine(34) synthetase TilS [Roseibium sp.]|nr:tRNA lysidine(34) synthetase TilS [Roseibium sp.]